MYDVASVMALLKPFERLPVDASVFNTVEMCIRYTDRLNRDITKAGETVFSIPLGEGKIFHVICIIFFYVIIEVTLILIH